ncbi:transglycosylase domain-containing protein [Paenibacillus tarimensis]
MFSKKRLLRGVLIFIFISFGCLALSAAAWVSGQDISPLDRPLPQPTIIYDREGSAVSRLSGSRIEPVPLAEMPQALRDAIVAVEDKRFYEHSGVDAGALIRALYRNTKAGDVVEGGSTITQQLAKNVFLTAEKTYSRKLKEAAMAIKIDSSYDKDTILEMYLNQIYFGEGSWGVQQAAKRYFGKPVRELTLAESALLAALPKAPSHYSPFVAPNKALNRRNLVLSLMKEQGMISEAEFKQAKEEPLQLHEGAADELNGRYRSYVNHVIEEAEALYGISEEELLRGGLRIYTNLDTRVQGAIEAAFANDSLFPESSDDIPVQAAAIVIDPASGGIRGLVGGRGKQVYRGFNRATQLSRQPGSAFKPLAVYAPALENGYTPVSRLYDGNLTIDGYTPQNYDRRTRGEVSLREAIVHSYNIPAVWLLNEIGVGKGFEYVQRSGIAVAEADRNLSFALGGLSEGVSPLQMAGAYGSFANEGKLVSARAIARIESKDGRVLYEAELRETQVLSPESAYTMISMLQAVVQEGTGKRAMLDRPTAGKTGTTQLPPVKEFEGIDGAKDAWFVGTTPELTAAVWMGYDQTDGTHYLQTTGGAYPAALFREIMSRALAGVPITAFRVPEGYREHWKDSEPKRQKEKDREREEKNREKERKREEKKRQEEQKREEKKREKERERDGDRDEDDD